MSDPAPVGMPVDMSDEQVARSSMVPLPGLEETLHYLEIAQRSAGMGYISLDPATMQLTFSEWVRELLGLESAVLPVDRVAGFVVPEERVRLMQQIATIIDQRAPFEFETVAIRFDGLPTRVRIAGNAIFTGDALTAFYAIAQDIEAFRTAEAEARASAEAAEAELAAGAQVIATLSHEIRTPLTGIIGIIDQLRREPRADERIRGLTLIEQSVEALLATLDGVLRGARARALGDEVARQEFSPVEVAQRVSELFRPLARRKGLSLTFEPPTTSSVGQSLGHPALLQQILSNLVSNAIKFTASGDVRLACHAPTDKADHWRFEIADTGSGIPPKRLKALFAVYGESGSDSLGRTGGAGLGLSITKQLIEDLKGSLSIESDPGNGTRVAVVIPFPTTAHAKGVVRAGGELRYLCTSASRAIAICAAAEEAGIIAKPLSETDEAGEVGADFLVGDETLLASLTEDVTGRFKTIIEICESGLGNALSTRHAKGRLRIAAARVAAGLQEIFSEMPA